MQILLDEWRVKTEKLAELQEWLGRALREVRSAPESDPRWTTYRSIEAAKNALECELEQLEKEQDRELTEHLQGTGPLTLELEEGETRILSATPRTAGGTADLLPADLLRVWRVATIFQGSVVGGKPLTFGDTEQILQFKTPKKGRKK